MERRKFLRSAVVTGAGATAAAVAAPAISQGKKEIVVVSTWPRDFPGLGISAQRLCARIAELSEGRLVPKYFAAGERVGAFDVFDDVASGNSDAYIGADYYWKGKHPALSFFTSVPFGMTTVEWNAWIKFKGGQALWDELSGGFGLKSIPCGATGTQMGGWFNKEIESAEDLKGLKMRIPGLGGDVMAKLGASPVSPGGQIYENLVSGSIDATEWVGPYNDYFLKFYEAAKYYYYPGMHEPGGGLNMAFNQKFWNKLSKLGTGADHRLLLRGACRPVRGGRGPERAVPGQAGQRARREASPVLRRCLRCLRGCVEGRVRGNSRAQPAGREDHRSLPDEPARTGGYQKIAEVAFSNQRNRVLGI
ncbi:MAG: TRAP transporter substrate-binding protein [Burkholderiaceae bacterium]